MVAFEDDLLFAYRIAAISRFLRDPSIDLRARNSDVCAYVIHGQPCRASPTHFEGVTIFVLTAYRMGLFCHAAGRSSSSMN